MYSIGVLFLSTLALARVKPVVEPAHTCVLMSVENPANRWDTASTYTFELWVDNTRMAQFHENAFEPAVKAAMQLKELGTCDTVQMKQRSDLKLPY